MAADAPLTPEAALERLERRLGTELHDHALSVNAVDAYFKSCTLDAILSTTHALAVLVTWPKLLEAGERAGKVKRFNVPVGGIHSEIEPLHYVGGWRIVNEQEVSDDRSA